MTQDTVPRPEATAHPQPLEKLVQLLVKLECPPQDRGALSALRAWWRPASRHLALPILADLLVRSGAGTGRLEEPEWTALPSLFALHRNHTPERWSNFGTTCRKLAGEKRETFDSHFRRLLACDGVEDLIQVLRRLTIRAANEGIALNYQQLGIDLMQWRKSADHALSVKVRWAKQYYHSPSEEAAPDAP